MTTTQTYGASVRRYEYRNAGVAAIWLGGAIVMVLVALWTFNQYQASAQSAMVEAKALLGNDMVGTLPTQANFDPAVPVPAITATAAKSPAFNSGQPDVCTPDTLAKLRASVSNALPMLTYDTDGRLWAHTGYTDKCEKVLKLHK